MKLRKGKTKSILESSIDSALLAVEIYNKPRTTFRSEGFITLMIIAWTRLFHAYFNQTIGDKYYYKDNNNRYKRIDGEKKTWELNTCISKYNKLEKSVATNLDFFIKLRNKIEHRYVKNNEIDIFIFGECQSLLYNFETLLIYFFSDEYSINESLVYSLQFSHLRTNQQLKANKSILSKDIIDIKAFVEKYRIKLDNNIFDSQEYSIKLIQIPKITNNNRSDLAIEFVKWSSLEDEDKKLYEKLNVIIKDNKIKIEGANINRYKPSKVVFKVNEQITQNKLTTNQHSILYKLFNIRPKKNSMDPFDTNTEFCLYDETHNDYVYLDSWINFLIQFLQNTDKTPSELRELYYGHTTLEIDKYKINK